MTVILHGIESRETHRSAAAVSRRGATLSVVRSMTPIQRERLGAVIRKYGFSSRGHHWTARVCTADTHDTLALEIALVGDPVVRLTVHVPDMLDVRTTADRISDAIVEWLAAADWRERGCIIVN